MSVFTPHALPNSESEDDMKKLLLFTFMFTAFLNCNLVSAGDSTKPEEIEKHAQYTKHIPPKYLQNLSAEELNLISEPLLLLARISHCTIDLVTEGDSELRACTIALAKEFYLAKKLESLLEESKGLNTDSSQNKELLEALINYENNLTSWNKQPKVYLMRGKLFFRGAEYFKEDEHRFIIWHTKAKKALDQAFRFQGFPPESSELYLKYQTILSNLNELPGHEKILTTSTEFSTKNWRFWPRWLKFEIAFYS